MGESAVFAQSLLVGLSIAAPVGPIGLLVIQRTLQRGSAIGLATGLGAAVADALYGAVGAFGVSSVIDALSGARVPLALFGGGFLFSAVSGPGTDLWRAPSWTGELQPLGHVEPPVSQITPGFDRLYLASATSYALRALDPERGEARDLSPLPLASSYGEMVFFDAWTAVVLAGVRGALATFDAGESWVPLGLPDAVNSVGLAASGKIIDNVAKLVAKKL